MRGSRGAACPPAPRSSCSTQRGRRGGERGAEPTGHQRPPPVPGPTWRELGRSKRRERSNARLVVVTREAEGVPLAQPPRLVPGATGAEAAMVPLTLAVRCLRWALLLPGHGPAQIFEWPRTAGQPLVNPPPQTATASEGHPWGTDEAPSAWASPSASSYGSRQGARGATALHSWVSSISSTPVLCLAQICSSTARARGAGRPLPAWCHPRGWGT